MKTTTIDIQSAPKNATIHYVDYKLGKAVNGQYSKNVRTGKCESIGTVPNSSLVSREHDIKRFMDDPDIDRFNYRWDELDAIVTINASANHSNVTIEMQDDANCYDVEDALLKALETINDDNSSAEVETASYSIRLYGSNYSSLLDLISAANNFVNFMSPIGIQ